MIGAAKDKSSLPGSLTALRVLLCLLITFLLAGTRAEAFFAPPDQAPGQIAAFQPDSTGKTTTAWQYDALDSLIAANSAGPKGWVNSGTVKDAEIIIDENLSPSLEPLLQNRGYYAYTLPKRMSDAEIIAYAQERGAVVMTNNTADFAKQGVGVLSVPSKLQTREALSSLMDGLDAVRGTAIGPTTVIPIKRP